MLRWIKRDERAFLGAYYIFDNIRMIYKLIGSVMVFHCTTRRIEQFDHKEISGSDHLLG